MADNWQSVLEFAAAGGHTDLVALALNEGVAIDTPLRGESITALVLAAASGHAETVRLLLLRGARAGAVEALAAASLHGSADTVRLLRPLAMGELESLRSQSARQAPAHPETEIRPTRAS